jgi:hypothetical protein
LAAFSTLGHLASFEWLGFSQETDAILSCFRSPPSFGNRAVLVLVSLGFEVERSPAKSNAKENVIALASPLLSLAMSGTGLQWLFKLASH